MIFETDSARKYLTNELARRKQANPRYSLRAFAKHLGIMPGELSEVLNGKRKLSLKSAIKTAQALGLTDTEMKQLIHIVQLDKVEAGPLLKEKTNLTLQQLSLDMFHVVSAWYCMAILNLADCHDFKWSEEWIAKRLGISTVEVKWALEKLESVGLVEMKNNKRVVAKDFVMTPAGIPSEALRSYHKQILNKAIEALEFDKFEDREVSGIGLAIDPKHLAAIKKDISDFQDQIASKYSKGKKSEVFQLELALIKLTRKGENNV